MTCPTCAGRLLTPEVGRLPVMLVGSHLDGFQGHKALVGRHGAMLARGLSRLGLAWTDFSLATATFSAPHPSELRQAALTCRHLDAFIAQVRPSVFLALGPIPFERLTGLRLPAHLYRGWVFPERLGRGWVIGTYAPGGSGVGPTFEQDPGLLLTWQADVAKAVAISDTPFAYEPVEALWQPARPVWDAFVRDFLADPTRPLGCDIETPYKRKADQSEAEKASDEDVTYTINEMNLGYEWSRGVSVPWTAPYVEGVVAMLTASQQHGRTLFWNGAYDRPRIEANSPVRFTNDHVDDLMDWFRVWRNCVPRKLGVAATLWPSMQRIAPWKQLGTADPYYRAMDVIALVRGRQDMLTAMTEEGSLPALDLFVRRLDPLLERMTRAGMSVDAERVAHLTTTLPQRLMAERLAMTAVVPDRKQKVWKTRNAAEAGLAALVRDGEVPAEAVLEPVAATKAGLRCEVCGATGVTKAHVTKKTLDAIPRP